MGRQIISKFFILLVFSSMVISSCYIDKEEELYPGGNAPCDTSNVSYNLDIAPILSSRCNGCHGGIAPSAGIKTDEYASLLVLVNNGRLKGSVNHSSGYSPMPKNAGKLPSCELAKINSWINAGAPQN